MRKFIILLLLASCTAANAQKVLSLGLRGGVNLTNMTFNENPLTKSNQAGFYVGPTLKVSTPLLNFGFDLSALYNQRGGKMANSANEELTITQKSISLPLNVRFGFGVGEQFAVLFKAGPQVDFNIGDKDFRWYDSSSYKMKDSNFSVNVGLALMLLNHFEINGNYNIACSKTGDGFWKNLESVKPFNQHINSWQIGAAYYF